MGRGVSPGQGISLIPSFGKYLLSEVPSLLGIWRHSSERKSSPPLSWSSWPSNSSGVTGWLQNS